MRNLALTLMMLALGPLARGQGETEEDAFDVMHGYTPTDLDSKYASRLAVDLKAMNTAMSDPSAANIKRAWEIYNEGGYSKTVAMVNLENPLEWTVPRGTILEGKAKNGKPIPLLAASDYHKGSQVMKVIYTESIATCRVGGLPDDQQHTDGCLSTPGFLHVGNHMSPIYYEYNMNIGNFNDQTIQELTQEASTLYRLLRNPENVYYDSYQKYVKYYGMGISNADFADQIISALRDSSTFEFKRGDSVWDFSNTNAKTRAEYLESIVANVVLGLSVTRSLEESYEACLGKCLWGDCPMEAINALDSAVAFYTGSLANEDNDGNFLYGRANELCSVFKTCGETGDRKNGLAKVNMEIFDLFNDMKQFLEQGNCGQTKEAKDQIMGLLNVPLFQGFILSSFKLNNPDAYPKEKQDAAWVAAKLFPLLRECDVDGVVDLKLDFDPTGNSLTNKFDGLRKHIDEVYECAGVCCADIGGIWEDKEDTYHKHFEPCVDTSEKCLAKIAGPSEVVSEDEKKNTGSKVAMVIIILLAILLTVYLYRRRTKNFPKKTRNEAPSDDDSVDSQDRMRRIT